MRQALHTSCSKRVDSRWTGRRLIRTITGGFGYLASSDLRAHFGLGAVARIDFGEVTWPDGRVERFTVSKLNKQIRLVRGAGESVVMR